MVSTLLLLFLLVETWIEPSGGWTVKPALYVRRSRSSSRNWSSERGVEGETQGLEILTALFPTHDNERFSDTPPEAAAAAAGRLKLQLPASSSRYDAGREAQGLRAGKSSVGNLNGHLTYGEFSFPFHTDLVDFCLQVWAERRRALAPHDADEELSTEQLQETARGLTFLDVGSGCGRLVVLQALRWPWKECVGVEIVPSLYAMGRNALEELSKCMGQGGGGAGEGAPQADLAHVLSNDGLRMVQAEMAPCKLFLGDINDTDDLPLDSTFTPSSSSSSSSSTSSSTAPDGPLPTGKLLGEADVIFCYSTAWPAYGDLLSELSYSVGTQCKEGTLVVTTDKRLASDGGPWDFRLLREASGANAETGGKSTGYVWEVVRSGRGSPSALF